MTRNVHLRAFAVAVGMLCIGAMNCGASTEYVNEGPGQPSDRASGSVPSGSLGVCKRRGTKRPPIVSDKLWEDAPECSGRTPESYIRLGYGAEDGSKPEAEQQVEQVMAALRDGQKEESGNNVVLSMLRGIRERAAKDPQLALRVSRETARTTACDLTYLLNTMATARSKIEPGKTCTAQAYNPKDRAETCIFDTGKQEGLWVTGGWACLMHTRAIGGDQSCHRLCAYDDYCARQVNCAAPDIELMLCTIGVCLPVQKGGFFY